MLNYNIFASCWSLSYVRGIFRAFLPPRAAQPRARVGIGAACEAKLGRSLSHVLDLPLLCLRSTLPWVKKVPFTACIVFSIKTQVLLMLLVHFLSLYPLFPFLTFLRPGFHLSDWGFLEGCFYNLWCWTGVDNVYVQFLAVQWNLLFSCGHIN